MQAVDAGRPLRGWMAQQQGAVVLQTRWQLQERRLTGRVQRQATSVLIECLRSRHCKVST